MQFRTASLAAVAALAFGVPAWAHHSHANYQPTEWINIEGTVKEVQWMNPHVWLYLTVADPKGGPARVWALEGGSPGALVRGGWKPDTVKPGDKISVRCHALKDGSDGCLLGYLTSDSGGVKDKEFD